MTIMVARVIRTGNDSAGGWQQIPRWLWALLAALLLYRGLYHLTYLGEVPFAVVTISDGALYEAAARDVLQHPPWGTRPFYLQGLYAYFMAAAMLVRPWPSLALLAQLVLAFVTLHLFFRAAVHAWGRLAAALALALLLSYPALAFYENKYLSVELGIFANVLILVCFGRWMRAPGLLGAALIGGASGLALLARPNMALAIPFTLWAMREHLAALRHRHWPMLGAMMLGLVVVMTPMGVRNWVVTGRPAVTPAHGGGTSYYIGNNPGARGVWNDAGGLVSGNVTTESAELTRGLDLDHVEVDARPRAIGRALYGRAGRFIRDQPAAWTWLQVRKAWLSLGNDELAQDFDWHGERNMIPWSLWGLPFGVLLGLGMWGAIDVRRRGRIDGFARSRRPWLWLLAGQLLATFLANVVFFTSAQHRLPMAIPLAFAAAPILLKGAERWSSRPRCPSWVGRASVAGLALALGLTAQGFWPRSQKKSPSPVHFYNLAVAYRGLDERDLALESIDRAVALRPSQPLFRLERARLLQSSGRYQAARADLVEARKQRPLPAWAETEVERLMAEMPHLPPLAPRQK